MCTYLRKPKFPTMGHCDECESEIHVNENKEFVCPVCKSSLHFCKNKYCFYLVEKWYTVCNSGCHLWDKGLSTQETSSSSSRISRSCNKEP